MEFNSNTPIYLQITERICEKILSEEWKADDRIPSVRELSAELQVNPNTAMRSYDYLQQKEIIYNKRGIGYFVSPDGKDKVMQLQKDNFINEEFPNFMKKTRLLGFSKTEIISMINEKY